jgi:hypothetical protein
MSVECKLYLTFKWHPFQMVGEDVMLPEFPYMYGSKLWNIVGFFQSYVEGLKTNQIKNIDICIINDAYLNIVLVDLSYN